MEDINEITKIQDLQEMEGGLMVYIDNRERALLSLASEAGLLVTVAPLPVADIVISRGYVRVLIERKTIDDLIGSIKDNRYNEQKSRLLGERQSLGSKIVYIIEGTKASVLAESAILSMVLRDQIHVFRTKNTTDTLACVINIRDKLAKDAFYADLNTSPGEYTCESNKTLFSEKAPRKTGISPESCYISMLIQIPGISTKTAIAVSVVYSCLSDLLVACREELKSVSDIRVSGNRKLGDKKAATIAKYLRV